MQSVPTLELSPHTALRSSVSFHLAPFPVTSFDRCMALVLTLLVAADVLLGRMVKLGSPDHLLALFPWQEILVMGISFSVCCWRPLPRLIDTAKAFLWAGSFASPLSFLVQTAGGSRFGLVDRQLAWIDGCMHINTALIHLTVARSPFCATCSILIYVLFVPLLSVAVILPCLFGYAYASHRFIVGVVIGVILGAALFALLPAAGPWMVESMRPSPLQATMTDYLLRLKMGYPMKAEMTHAAIMSFPSEHVLVAVLGVEALSVIRAIRRPVQVLGTLICLSTVTTGWHYGVDVLGGLAVAWIASKLARITCDRLLEMDAAKN